MSELEICDECGEPTGNAGEHEDSLYLERFGGPYCDNCYNEMIPVLASAYNSGKAAIESQDQALAEKDAAIAELEKIAEAVGHIGVDFGFGNYELEAKYIHAARDYFKHSKGAG